MDRKKQLEMLYKVQENMRTLQESGLWEPLHDSKLKVIKLIQELESVHIDKLNSRTLAIKTATPEELLENEAVRELVEALRNIKSTSKKDLREDPDYWGEMIVGEAMQALKKFEVKK